MKKLSEGEELLAMQLKAYKIPFEREYQFAKPRKWRFDFVIYHPDIDPKFGVCTGLAIEIEGGIWTGGAHTRGKHFESDCIKYAEAICLGWKVLRFSTGQIKSGVALDYISRLI